MTDLVKPSNAFAAHLARKLSEIAAIHFFSGSQSHSSLMFVLDHQVGLSTQVHPIEQCYSFGAKVRHLRGENYVTSFFQVETIVSNNLLLKGPVQQESICEAIAQQLVTALSNTVEKLTNPSFGQIIEGDNIGMKYDRRRLWLK